MDISELIDSATGERKAFLEATTYQSPDVKFYCRMIYYTGCRLSEALEVSPTRLDYQERGVIFRTLKQNKAKKAKYRFVELPETYLEALHDVYGVKDAKDKKAAPESPIWGFTDRTAQNYIKTVMKEADISGLKSTSRGLRHSMGVMLAKDNVPLNVIQKLLGHSDIKNTMIYTQVISDERRGMISRVW
jgi:integrase/recombinase XerD